MKRYRPLAYHFDARANQLTQEIVDSWEPQVKDLWLETQRQVKESVIHDYGVAQYERKISDFREQGVIPFSVISYHSAAFKEIRDAFVAGAYYPALTAAVSLGEQLLNHLLLDLREHFRESPEYKNVYRKNSFDDWDLAIRVLSSWKVLRPESASDLRELQPIRHQAVHFNPAIHENARDYAHSAVRLMRQFIEHQFGAFGNHPWFITSVPGLVFIKKEFEDHPFIKKFYLPNCAYVGPRHTLRRDGGYRRWLVNDPHHYPDSAVSDEEFARLFVEAQEQARRRDA